MTASTFYTFVSLLRQIPRQIRSRMNSLNNTHNDLDQWTNLDISKLWMQPFLWCKVDIISLWTTFVRFPTMADKSWKCMNCYFLLVKLCELDTQRKDSMTLGPCSFIEGSFVSSKNKRNSMRFIFGKHWWRIPFLSTTKSYTHLKRFRIKHDPFGCWK